VETALYIVIVYIVRWLKSASAFVLTQHRFRSSFSSSISSIRNDPILLWRRGSKGQPHAVAVAAVVASVGHGDAADAAVAARVGRDGTDGAVARDVKGVGQVPKD
jgi:hypothetical protein